MANPPGNEDPANKVGNRVIDKPELPPDGIPGENEAMTEVLSGQMQLKRGVAGKFEVFCDEPARIGGTDKYPSPMSYLAMAIGF